MRGSNQLKKVCGPCACVNPAPLALFLTSCLLFQFSFVFFVLARMVG